MISKEFLKEYAEPDELKRYIELIKRDCQPYLQQAKPFDSYTQLLRGMGGRNDNFLKKQIRLENRKPKDIPQELHNRINQYFEQHYGASFRNALFTSSDYIQAENYGNVYYIFPIGDFKFLWSPDIEDLFMMYDEYRPWFRPGSDVPQEEQDRRTQEAMDEFFKKDILGGKWYNSNLSAGIDSGNEVMIRAKEYYAISLIAVEQEPTAFFEALQ